MTWRASLVVNRPCTSSFNWRTASAGPVNTQTMGACAARWSASARALRATGEPSYVTKMGASSSAASREGSHTTRGDCVASASAVEPSRRRRVRG